MNLTKLSQKIWEIVGLAVAVLFLLGILALFVGIGYAIFQYKAHHVGGLPIETPENTGDLKIAVEYGLPLPYEESDYFMIPVKLEKRKPGEAREMESAPRRVSKGVSYEGSISSGSYFPYWGPFYNVIFIHKKTKETHPLLLNKGYIQGVYFPEKRFEEKDQKIKPTFILFRIATRDTNHDGFINEKDASAGFLAGVDGTGLTQVTPDETQMHGWYYDPNEKKIFIEVVQDANKDLKFNWDDPQTVVGVNVLAPKIGQEFVSSETKKQVESILLRK